jgi:NAD(P)-dependent dehydrogenase (short-subunit alcohol dehydrogenase family)
MKDKIVFITGAARGLGAGLARKVVENGGKAFIVDMSTEAVAAQVELLGPNAAGCRADVTKLPEITDALAQCATQFGSVDMVVVNAGILRLGTIEHMNPQEFLDVMNVNVNGAFYTIRAAIPHLRASKGYLQVISSLAAAIHVPLMSHYAASKAAVEALADVARQEMALDGVDVGCVHPTFARTDMIKENDTGRLWGGHKGAFGSVEPELVIDAMYKGLINRTRKIIAPKPITPLILAPGLFHKMVEGIGKLQGSDKRLRAFRDEEAATRVKN